MSQRAVGPTKHQFAAGMYILPSALYEYECDWSLPASFPAVVGCGVDG